MHPSALWGKDELSPYKKKTCRKLISHLSLINYALENANRVDDGKRNEILKEKWIFTAHPTSAPRLTSLHFVFILSF